jgi:branched-chain amino acid transport system substrate-binding protein
LAFKEASDSGQLLGGQKISVVRADSTCIDAAAATAAAERLITSDKVVGMSYHKATNRVTKSVFNRMFRKEQP